MLDEAEREVLTARWAGAMHRYLFYLGGQHAQDAEMAVKLTVLELPNLFALLDLVQHQQNPEAIAEVATAFYIVLRELGKPRLLERVGRVRDAALDMLGSVWNHARFEAEWTRIEQRLNVGMIGEALDDAHQLLRHARAAGEQAYLHADYDLAMACWLLGRVMRSAGDAARARSLLDEGRLRFDAISHTLGREAARMAGVCCGEIGHCLLVLGRLDEAAAAYDERIRLGEQVGDIRGVATGKGQLGAVRELQGRYSEALTSHAEARNRFTQLDQPEFVAVSWHLTGNVYLKVDQPEAAEEAYRKALAIRVRLGDIARQADVLNQLGLLYGDTAGHLEESVAFHRKAADIYVQTGDLAKEGIARNNMAISLRKLHRHGEARQEIRRSIRCKAPFGHAVEPWNSWGVLASIEMDAGNVAAAVEAKQKAIASYLAYRHDGGENHGASGRISLAVTHSLLEGNPYDGAALLQQLTDDPDAEWLRPFIGALRAIMAGSRDPALAAASDLSYMMAAEILFLIETLDAAQR